MTRTLPSLTLVLALAALMPVARAAAQSDPSKATERCEKEVADTIRRVRGKAVRDVQFVAARRVLLPGGDDETGVRGEGHYRSGSGASVSFSYGCAYSAATDATSGVVFRDLAAGRAAPEKPFEPDLTNVSPEACESAAAAALKKRHPRVARINFGSDSRRMQPGENGRVELLGQGSVERAAGMNLIPFSYRCEVDPRSGRIVGVSTKE